MAKAFGQSGKQLKSDTREYSDRCNFIFDDMSSKPATYALFLPPIVAKEFRIWAQQVKAQDRGGPIGSSRKTHVNYIIMTPNLARVYTREPTARVQSRFPCFYSLYDTDCRVGLRKKATLSMRATNVAFPCDVRVLQ